MPCVGISVSLAPVGRTKALSGAKTTDVELTEREKAVAELKAEATRPIDNFIDEKALLAESTFPIKPADLIALTKKLLEDESDYLADPKTVDTENFVLEGPVVGPLSYETFREAFKTFSLITAFPGICACLHNFWVDPYEPSRVWFTTRPYGKNTGPVMGMEPTNKIVDGTPAMHSLVFNGDGKVVKATIGYPMDRSLGNTGGLSGAFGPLYAIGKGLPFREAQPYKRSLRFKLFNLLSTLGEMFARKD